MQTERAKRMDSAGEEASLNSPELPWNQLYWKRRTESRIQLRRRVCFTGPAAAAVTGVLAIIILAAGSVSSDSEFVTVQSSVNCTEGQDCILSCSFNYTAGGWDEKSAVIWRRAETGRIVHSYHDNTDQLAHQLPQYVNRTSLFDSELQHGNASLLLRRVREEDAGEYRCSVSTPRLYGSGLTEVVVVPAQPTTAPAPVTVLSSDGWGLGALLLLLLPLLALCVIAGCYARLWIYKNRWKSNLASSPAQAVPLSAVIEEPSKVRPLPCTAQYTQFNTSSQNESLFELGNVISVEEKF
ncbi:myelin-oligodendrocyte glycoprotein-like isoform X1 [Acipenser ruthenus]|uniref:myelin-oligodendrocyte glycoprotein-like isoform X1 n=1 Tax=Acipenser ruthenus TaxID=7906 RepID=UPI002742546F|nr:myelin-oligodendrocyte glycoprotein-like isoform X1 [Acipenser ruthenus]XP_058868333.1 myelin-oligodendrocyte glycoprotein-like isoform X1 [Acipenser ruthenus]